MAPPRSPRSLWKTNARRFARDKPKKPLRLRIGKSAAGISKTGSDSARNASGPESGKLSTLYSQAGFPERAGGPAAGLAERQARERSEEQTSELQSLMRHSYAVSCLYKQK